MKNKQLIKLVGYSFLVFFLALIQLSQGVDAILSLQVRAIVSIS